MMFSRGLLRRLETKAHAILASCSALQAYAARPKVGAAAKVVHDVQQRPKAALGDGDFDLMRIVAVDLAMA
jgi:hypothetical protein